MNWRARRKARYFAKCSCGRTYNRKQWYSLKNLGRMHLPADATGPESNIEMRNCVCGSTMAVEFGPSVSRDPRPARRATLFRAMKKLKSRPRTQRDPRIAYYVTVRFFYLGKPRQVIMHVYAGNSHDAKRIARERIHPLAKIVSINAVKIKLRR